MTPTDFRPGDELTAARLNEANAAARSAQFRPDGSSGLVGIQTPAGSSYRAQLPPEGWFKVVAFNGGSPASYQLTEQIDGPAGAFADGPRSVPAYPLPGSGSPPTDGSAIVRAWKQRASWRFDWKTCS